MERNAVNARRPANVMIIGDPDNAGTRWDVWFDLPSLDHPVVESVDGPDLVSVRDMNRARLEVLKNFLDSVEQYAVGSILHETGMKYRILKSDIVRNNELVSEILASAARNGFVISFVEPAERMNMCFA